MTKYEAFLTAHRVVTRAIQDIHLALGRNEKGRDNTHIDKGQFKFSLSSTSLEMGHGYYGSSSYYRLDTADTVAYVQRACNELASVIGARAMELALADLEQLRMAAQAEARSVLGECLEEV